MQGNPFLDVPGASHVPFIQLPVGAVPLRQVLAHSLHIISINKIKLTIIIDCILFLISRTKSELKIVKLRVA
jgi:hypothetical protein